MLFFIFQDVDLSEAPAAATTITTSQTTLHTGDQSDKQATATTCPTPTPPPFPTRGNGPVVVGGL